MDDEPVHEAYMTSASCSRAAPVEASPARTRQSIIVGKSCGAARRSRYRERGSWCRVSGPLKPPVSAIERDAVAPVGALSPLLCLACFGVLGDTEEGRRPRCRWLHINSH